MAVEHFLGTTFKALMAASDKNRKESFSTVFFKPYESGLDLLGRTTSIATDSLVFTGYTAYFALRTVWELFKAIGNFVTGNFAKAKENIGEFGSGLIATGLVLTLAIISPVVNTVDYIGGAVNTVRACCESSEEEISVNQQPGLF